MLLGKREQPVGASLRSVSEYLVELGELLLEVSLLLLVLSQP